MGEDSNLGVARAFESDEESGNSDLQHRMDEARESITDAVSEINDADDNQIASLNESATEILDWREQVRKHPVACSVGALGVGLVVGYGLAGIIEGDDESLDAFYQDTDTPLHQDEGGGPSAFTDEHSYAAHARAIAHVDQQEKPGLIDRFKETRAYDRLQEEVGDLGNRVVNELSTAARTIVLPALLNKLKEILGVGLSSKRHPGNASARHSSDDPLVSSQAASPVQRQAPNAPEAAIGELSEIGKPVYPTSTEQPTRFDRLVSDTPTKSALSDNAPHINLNYDDRYERESKLFSRGSVSGFPPDKSESKESKESSEGS